MIKLLINFGIDTKIKTKYGEVVKEYFEKNVESNYIPAKRSHGYNEIMNY